MEITLEKVELVKDRTGVSYKEAKDALEAADGNVVDAIIGIEETINLSAKNKVNDQAKQVIDKVKAAVEKGNVSRIKVKKDDDVVLNLPVNIGILGTVLAPLAAVIGAIAAYGTNCTIELVKDDGTIVDVIEKAEDKFGTVVDKGSDIAETIKEKGSTAFSTVSEKVQDTVSKTMNSDKEKTSDFKDTVDEMWEEAKGRVNKAADDAGVKSDVAEAAEEVKEEAAAEVAEEIKEEAAEGTEEIKEEAAETVAETVAETKDEPAKAPQEYNYSFTDKADEIISEIKSRADGVNNENKDDGFKF